MATKICHECKAPVNEADNKCPYCGKRFKFTTFQKLSFLVIILGIFYMIGLELLEKDRIEGINKRQSEKIEKDNRNALSLTPEKKEWLNKELDKTLSVLRKVEDEIEGTTTYQAEKNITRNKDLVSLIIVRKEDRLDIKMTIMCANNEPLYSKSVKFLIDDQRFEIPFSTKKHFDNNQQPILEWETFDMTNEITSVVVALVQSKKALVRCVGDEKNKDRIITVEEKRNIKTMLGAISQIAELKKKIKE